MKYRLEKIAMEKSSSVRLGSFVIGMLLVSKDGEVEETIGGIEEGSSVLVGSSFYDVIKTSPIVGILQKTDDMIVFKTQTSTYMLEKFND
jgi:hypothetical protein